MYVGANIIKGIGPWKSTGGWGYEQTRPQNRNNNNTLILYAQNVDDDVGIRMVGPRCFTADEGGYKTPC